MVKKTDYKATASSIFKDVLGDKSEPDATLHKDADAQVQKSEAVQSSQQDVRLHVFIREEIENKLLDEVIRRKKDKSALKKSANKRAIVEEALELFL